MNSVGMVVDVRLDPECFRNWVWDIASWVNTCLASLGTRVCILRTHMNVGWVWLPLSAMSELGSSCISELSVL